MFFSFITKSRLISIVIIVLSFFAFIYAALIPDKKSYSHTQLAIDDVAQKGAVLGGASEMESTPSPKANFSVLLDTTKKRELPEIPLDITAKSYVVYDINEKRILTEKNGDMPLPPASITKIMTALVALEDFNLNDHTFVPKDCIGLDGSNIPLAEGDELSIQSLLYTLLLPSASDAACTLARAGNNPYEFLSQMNEKAKEFGLKHTNFDNVIGLDNEENHYSSARDLLIIAEKAMEVGMFRRIVGTPQYFVTSYNSDRIYNVRNTNELLFSVPGTIGIKTGYTDKALGCLVYAYENRGKSAIIVVMGSKERFVDTKKLLDWYLSTSE